MSISDVISRFRWIFRHRSKFVTPLLLLMLGFRCQFYVLTVIALSNGFHLTVAQVGKYHSVFTDHSCEPASCINPRCTISVILESFMYLSCVSLLRIHVFSWSPVTKILSSLLKFQRTTWLVKVFDYRHKCLSLLISWKFMI